MSNLTATPATLSMTLKSLKDGDMLTLDSGDFKGVTIDSLKFSASNPITISSTTSANIRSMLISNCTGINFVGVLVKFTPDTKTTDYTPAVQIINSQDISWSKCKLLGGNAIVGTDPATGAAPSSGNNVLGYPNGRGFSVDYSSRVSLIGNDVSNFHRGIALNKATFIAIRGNEVYGCRTTPVVGGEISDVVVDGNHLHDSKPYLFGKYDHGDMLAFWCNPGQTTACARIKVTNNLMEQTDGQPLLGMWFQNNAVDPTLPAEAGCFTDLLVDGNKVYMSHIQGITIYNGAKRVVVSNNTLMKQPKGADPKWIPAILAKSPGEVTVENNIVNAVYDINNKILPMGTNKVPSGLAPAVGPQIVNFTQTASVSTPASSTTPDTRDAQIATLTSSLATATTQVKTLTDANSSLTSKNTDLSNQVSALAKQVSDLTNAKSVLQGQVDSYKSAISSINTIITKL